MLAGKPRSEKTMPRRQRGGTNICHVKTHYVCTEKKGSREKGVEENGWGEPIQKDWRSFSEERSFSIKKFGVLPY